MLEYDYTRVVIEHVEANATGVHRLGARLVLEPDDQTMELKFQTFGPSQRVAPATIHLEDWRDVFREMVAQRMHLGLPAAVARCIAPTDLRIQGERNPLIDMIVFAFCSAEAALLLEKLADCAEDEIREIHARSRGFTCRSAVRYSGLLCDLMDRAYLRARHALGDGPRLSRIMHLARSTVASNEEATRQAREQVESNGNKVVFAEGPFLVVEVLQSSKIDYCNPESEFALMIVGRYADDSGFDEGAAYFVGNRGLSGYAFVSTVLPHKLEFTRSKISEIPGAAYGTLEGYFDGIG